MGTIFLIVSLGSLVEILSPKLEQLWALLWVDIWLAWAICI
jgi:hypothetical protein